MSTLLASCERPSCCRAWLSAIAAGEVPGINAAACSYHFTASAGRFLCMKSTCKQRREEPDFYVPRQRGPFQRFEGRVVVEQRQDPPQMELNPHVVRRETRGRPEMSASPQEKLPARLIHVVDDALRPPYHRRRIQPGDCLVDDAAREEESR